MANVCITITKSPAVAGGGEGGEVVVTAPPADGGSNVVAAVTNNAANNQRKRNGITKKWLAMYDAALVFNNSNNSKAVSHSNHDNDNNGESKFPSSSVSLPLGNNDDDNKDNNDGNAEQKNDYLLKWIKKQRTDYWFYLTDPNSTLHSMTNEKVIKLRDAKFAWIDEDKALYEANLLAEKKIPPNTSITTSNGQETIMRRQYTTSTQKRHEKRGPYKKITTQKKHEKQTHVNYHEIYTTAERLSKHPRLNNAANESASTTMMEPHLSPPLSSFVADGSNRQTPMNVMGAIQHLAPLDQTIVQNYIASLESTIISVESDCHSLRQRCIQMQLQLSCLNSNGITHSSSAAAAAAASKTATISTQSDEDNEASTAAAAADQNQNVITESLLASGYKLNASGAPYRNGAAKSLTDKAAIASIYLQMKLVDPNVSERAVAKAARVSRTYAKKVIDEVNSGQLVDDTTKPRKRKRGPGVYSITPEDARVLLAIQEEVGDYRDCCEMFEEHDTTMNGTTTTTKKKKAVVQKHNRWNVPISFAGYSDQLFKTTGHRVSKSVICKWFQSQAAGASGGVGRMSETTGEEGHDEADVVAEENDGVAAALFDNDNFEQDL
jgi:hypothetical protein